MKNNGQKFQIYYENSHLKNNGQNKFEKIMVKFNENFTLGVFQLVLAEEVTDRKKFLALTNFRSIIHDISKKSDRKSFRGID